MTTIRIHRGLVAIAALVVGACGVGPSDGPTQGDHQTQLTNDPSLTDDDYGVYIKCDGSDVTSQLEDALKTSGARVMLSAGICKISDVVHIRAVRGIHLIGQGRGATGGGTLLEWNPSASQTGPVLELERVREGTFEQFGIAAASGKTIANAIRIHNQCVVGETSPEFCVASEDKPPAAYGASSSLNTFRDILVRDGDGTLQNGVYVSLPPNFDGSSNDGFGDVKNDFHKFFGVSVINYTENGFKLEGRNAKGLTFFGCNCESWAGGTGDGNTCVNTDLFRNNTLKPASFQWYGGSTIGQKVANFLLGWNDGVVISGVYSEKSRMFLRVPEDGEREFNVTVTGVRFEGGHMNDWNTNADYMAIDVVAPGPLVIEGSGFGQANAAEAEPISFCWRKSNETATAGGGSFVFQGNIVATTLGAANPFAPSSECRYPTTQESNTICTNCDDLNDLGNNGPRWEPMPLHAHTLDVTGGMKAKNVRKIGASRTFMELNGNNGDVLCSLRDGVVGQEIVIRSTVSSIYVGDISNPSSRCTNVPKNIHMASHADWLMGQNDTLVLRLFPDGEWLEMSRSDND